MEKLVERLNSILKDIKEDERFVIDEKAKVIDKIKSLIQDVTASKCSNGDFCGILYEAGPNKFPYHLTQHNI